MNATILKFIAVLFMTIDHIGYYLFPYETMFRILGRLALPIFAYFIAEGCTHTKHRVRYLLSVLTVGLLCSCITYYFEQSLYQSIFITFAFSIALIFLLDGAMDKSETIICRVLAASCFVSLLVVCYLLFRIEVVPGLETDYGFFGILTPLLVWLGRNKIQRLCLLALGLLLIYMNSRGIQIYSFVALIPLALYDGTRGPKGYKAFFYVYYPLHIVVLRLLSYVM